MSGVRLIAWDGNANFGDRLTGHILRRDYNVEPFPAPWSHANLVGAGSILQMAPASFDGIVFTTGTVQPCRLHLPDADIRAVRGALTMNALLDGGTPTPVGNPQPGASGRIVGDVEFGDIGILAPPLSLEVDEPRDAAWLPHYADHRKGYLDREWPRGVPFDAELVDILSHPAELIEQVGTYREVHTSSLHGMILADALGIPHAYHPAPEVIGGDWKFLDYLSAFGISNLEPGVVRLTPRELMIERQTAIRGVLDRIVEELT